MDTEQQPADTKVETDHEANDVSMVEDVKGSPGGETATGAKSEEPTLNGKAEYDANEATVESSEAPKASDDVEMKTVSEPTEAAEPTVPVASTPAQGTPAPAKRVVVGGSSKKKSSAVPEHKSKKLNKKKSRPLTNLDAAPGEYYFARMKGHPPWPSVICDEEMLPQSLLTTRPVTARLPDGSFKKPEYADGGKRAYERTFPVMFLHTNEFAWIPNTELAPLDIHADTTKNPSEKGKSKLLLAAFAKAAEANDLDHFKTMLADHQKALQEDQAEKEERAAKKAKKAARKSSDAAALAENADEMEVDDEGSAAKPKSKKRKKAVEESDAEEKPAKTPKTATKLTINGPKKVAEHESSTKKKASRPKAKAAKNSSDEDATTPKGEEKPLSPAAAKEIKEKKVLYFRHKLQRGFLSRDSVPKEDEMKLMSDFLSELETYPDLEGSIIRATKINKVLKAIIKLPHIPLEEQFKFKPRSQELLDKWNDTLSKDQVPGGDKADEKTAEDKAEDKLEEPKAATTNGDHPKSVETEAEKAEAGESAAPEEASEAKLENKIGTTVEGEKEAEEKAAAPETTEAEKPTEEKSTDAPAVDTAPAQEYKPPAVTEGVESTA